MDSVPPATTTSAPPLMMRSAAMAIACSPEEQKRLIVSAETSTGNPARSDAIRATFIPCSASGVAQPRITSSISLGSTWGTRSSAPMIAIAANSSGRVARRVPLNARPIGVRTEDAMITSLIKSPTYILPVAHTLAVKVEKPTVNRIIHTSDKRCFFRAQEERE